MRLRWLHLALFTSIALPCLITPAWANSEVYERLLPATAWLQVPLENGSTSYGTGVIVDKDRRWLLTNYHVVEEAATARVFFPIRDGSRVIAERTYYLANALRAGIGGRIIARDPRKDLALIQVDRLPPHVRSATLADRSAPIGAGLHVVGNARGDVLWVYSWGKVRQRFRKDWDVRIATGRTLHLRATVLETSLAINQGDSGGPVVDDDGRLVGLVSSFLRNQRLVTTCIDISEIRTFLSRVAKGDPFVGGGNRRLPEVVPASKHRFAVPGSETERGNERFPQTFRLRQILDKTAFVGSYVVEADGVIRVQVGEDRLPYVYIDPELDAYRGLELRRIWSIAKVYDGPPPADMALNLLLANHRRKIGAWEIQRLKNGKYLLVYCHRLAAGASVKELEAAIRYVHAESRDLFHGLIVGVDSPSLEIVDSTWAGVESRPGSRRVSIRFEKGGRAVRQSGTTTTNGTWKRTGNAVTISFVNEGVTYQGLILNGRLGGVIRGRNGGEWAFQLQRQ